MDPQETDADLMILAEPPPPPLPQGPRAVSKFEHDLLTILRFLLGRVAPQQALALVTAKQDAPPCLSKNCVHLVRDSLAKGVVLHLTRVGGWRDEKFLEGGQPVGGRIWNRVPLDGRRLMFGRATLDFLIWLTAEKVDSANDKWLSVADLTPADELFLALALEQLRPDVGVRNALKLRNAFTNNPFCWLFAPADVAGDADANPPDFAPLFAGPRAAMLECLQPWLTRHWTATERAKQTVTDWRAMQRQGGAEVAMLSAFLAAAETANRPDLARFALRALSRVLHGHTPDATFWTGGLSANPPTRLADRLATQRNALAFPQQAETFARWDRQSRAIGYFDEGYAASQLWKEEYEAANGPDVMMKSKRALDQLEPLKT